MMSKIGIMCLVAVMAISACSEKEKRQKFDGTFYPAKARSVKGDRQTFKVNVSRVNRGLNGAREAGRHAATEYCIKQFGFSKVDWAMGPDADEADLDLRGSSLRLSGKCQIWE